jgi:inorganic pyrophosphatase
VSTGRLTTSLPLSAGEGSTPPEGGLIIEIPTDSFIKRGSTGHVDFVSLLPPPFNYGSVPNCIGLEADLFDALVLGPRLHVGTLLRLRAWGAVALTDRGMSDDKLACSTCPPSHAEMRNVLRPFRFHARCKGLLNFLRQRPDRNACDDWLEATQAQTCAQPRDEGWRGLRAPF